MKKVLLISFVILLASKTFSQLLSWSPAFVQETSSRFVITLYTTNGKSGYAYSDDISAGASSVYYHCLKSVDKDSNLKLTGVLKIKFLVNGKLAKVHLYAYPD